ncbi:TAP42-like protein [Cylindrobasidium torrendii FP15055 ss-10]|uniref:TAP42-like protein n=1 Tax=Cylindrobasidium torrendii FP15055 ss-10 TaxID=1314674 RepID=A0A0D7AVI5_9AGAR|nr:TAP42-like protein [Cylindrobasidium torrendii FP15055 ss-10]
MADLSLSQLYHRALGDAAKAYDLPVIEDSTQEVVQACLTDLKTVQQRVSALALFSSNETLEDMTPTYLIYLTVPYVIAEVQGRVRTVERDERLASLIETENLYQHYVASLEQYGIVSEDVKLFSELPVNPASRRELKIKQYKHEKELRERIKTVRKRRQQRIAETENDFSLIQALLPSASTDQDEEDEDAVRESNLLLLRLLYGLAQAQLKNIADELVLLRTAPPPMPYFPPSDNENQHWRLDGPVQQQGPLLSPSGQPLRPFTILPSGATDRARLQSQVFGPGHNLPSMSIDEYLEIERQRGKFISGGGPASEAEPTSSEQLALDAEMDGTREGDEKEEQKRQKDERWAQYTDSHAKGEGNTMNRG